MQLFCRYEQEHDGLPVIGDDIVLTYKDNHVKNAYGSAEMIAGRRGLTGGNLCSGVSLTNSRAIRLAQDADAASNGAGKFEC